jgi:hypothetical protein
MTQRSILMRKNNKKTYQLIFYLKILVIQPVLLMEKEMFGWRCHSFHVKKILLDTKTINSLK